MRALLSSLILALSLPAVAAERGYSSEGIEASAVPTRETAFAVQGPDPLGLSFEEGQGRFELRATDRVSGKATYGDTASLTAEVSLAQGRYEIRMDLSRRVSIPNAPPGGVGIDVPVHGGGLGLPYAVRAHAAFAVVGVGSVSRNGRLLTDNAVIYGFALSHGNHADDSSHQLLNRARAGDTEVEILVVNIPPTDVPGGMLRVFFDDVQITVDGASPSSEALVKSAPGIAPEDARRLPNYGGTVNYGIGGTLDVNGGQVVGTRTFQDGRQVSATGVDATTYGAGNDSTLSIENGTNLSPLAARAAQANRQITQLQNPQGGFIDPNDTSGQNVAGQGFGPLGTDTGTPSPDSVFDLTATDDSVRARNSLPATPLPSTIQPFNSISATSQFPTSPPAFSANPLVAPLPAIRPTNSNPVTPLGSVDSFGASAAAGSGLPVNQPTGSGATDPFGQTSNPVFGTSTGSTFDTLSGFGVNGSGVGGSGNPAFNQVGNGNGVGASGDVPGFDAFGNPTGGIPGFDSNLTGNTANTPGGSVPPTRGITPLNANSFGSSGGFGAVPGANPGTFSPAPIPTPGAQGSVGR